MRGFSIFLVTVFSIAIVIAVSYFLISGGKTNTEAFLKKIPIANRTLELDPFVANLEALEDGTVGGHYVRASLALVFKNKKAMKYGKEMLPAIRDIILSKLSSLTYNDAIDTPKRQGLKEGLYTSINQYMGGFPLEEILIIEYIVE